MQEQPGAAGGQFATTREGLSENGDKHRGKHGRKIERMGPDNIVCSQIDPASS